MVKSDKAALELWVDRGLGLGCILLVCAIAYTLAQLTWFYLNPSEGIADGEPALKPGQAVARTQSSSDINVPRLQAWNLFGKKGVVKPSKPKPKPRPTTVPETTLRLELEGVFSGEKETGSAIIAEKGKPGKLYRIGERLPGNAVLKEVYEDRVILKRNGRDEVLRFPELQGIASPSTGSNASSRNRNSSRSGSNRSKSNAVSRKRDKLGRQKNVKSRTGKMISSSRNIKPERLFQSFAEDFQSNPKDTLSDLGVEVLPVSQGGGYRVSNNVPAHIMKLVGLREGDIIRSVNGQQLGDIRADQSLYQELMSYNEVSVEVERGSRRFTVNVPVPKR